MIKIKQRRNVVEEKKIKEEKEGTKKNQENETTTKEVWDKNKMTDGGKSEAHKIEIQRDVLTINVNKDSRTRQVNKKCYK
jgi:hypothetical protein